MVKSPAKARGEEIQVRSWVRKDSLGVGNGSLSVFFPWKIPWAEQPGGYSL